MHARLKFIASLCLIGMSSSTIAVAEETPAASYTDMMARIQELESQMQAHHRQVRTVSYAPIGAEQDVGRGECADCFRCGGFYAFYENVIVQPFFTRNTAYLLNDPPPNNDGYQEVSFDIDYSYSPRIEFGFLSNCGELGGRARYWHFDDSTNLNANDPNGNIFVAFTEDSAGDIGLFDVNDALLSHSLKLDVVDLEALFRQGNWTYTAGLRYARMEQTYDGTELNVVTPERFLSGHNFDGWGLTAAAEVLHPWRGGTSLFARARGSFVYGQSGFFATNPDNNARLTNNNNDDLLAIGELQLGVDWRRCLARDKVLFVTLALEAQHWSSAGTGGPTNNAPFDEGNYQNAIPQDANLGFFGGSIGFGLLF